MRTFKLLLLIFSLHLALVSFSDVPDSLAYASEAGVADVAESDPGLFIVMMLMLLGALRVCFLIFIFACLATLGSILLVAFGIASVSFWIGWYNKSYGEGIKWLLLLGFGILGMGMGTLLSFFLKMVWLENQTLYDILIWGVLVGAIAGAFSGWVVFKAIQKVFDFVKKKHLA